MRLAQTADPSPECLGSVTLPLSRERQGLPCSSGKRDSPGTCVRQEQALGGLGPKRAGVTPGHQESAVTDKSFQCHCPLGGCQRNKEQESHWHKAQHPLGSIAFCACFIH